MRIQTAGLALGLLLTCVSVARAGPPYVTDDPEPTDTGHWEIYNFALGAGAPGGAAAGEAGVDLNYGGAKDLQLTLTLPLAFDTGGPSPHVGTGVIEAAAKYKLIHQDPHGLIPDVAVFPRVFVPTASSRFASTRPSLLLPVWSQKDFGPWSVFGGGGYQINPGPQNRNFWVSGLVLTRQFGDRLNVGAELYHQSRDAVDAKPFTWANLGVIYKVAEHWSLLASGGPTVQNARQQGRYDFYVALEATY